VTAIDELRKAAKGKAFDEAKAESDIHSCVEAYHSGYLSADMTNGQRLLADQIRARMASRKTISQGKDHIEKMRRHIAKLREDATAILDCEHMDTLLFAGGIYENNKWWSGDETPGHEAVVDDLTALIRMLDQIDERMEAVTSVRVPSRRRSNHVERLTLALGDVYREYTGREPASGTQGIDERGGSPFVHFVQAVLRDCDRKEANRSALGQSVYTWLREDRALREILEFLEQHGG